jgi:transposase-like protein
MEKQEKKKKARQKQLAVLKGKERESQTLVKLVSVLEDLEAKGKYVDIQVCPRCKSPRVRRVGAMAGDMSGHIGLTPVKYECPDCGWRERLVLKATNRPMNIKDVAIIAEGLNSKEKEKE